MGSLGKGPWNEWERDHSHSRVFSEASFSAALWLHRAVDVLPRETSAPQRASIARSVFEAADAAATFCPVLDSNFALLLESLRRARVAEAAKACLDFFSGADFFSGGGEEVVSMATPETMTKRRFLTHPCSTVAYAMRVLFFVLCSLKPKKVYGNLRFSIFGATLPSGQGT